MEEAQSKVLSYVQSHIPTVSEGSLVRIKHLRGPRIPRPLDPPDLDAFLHYRVVDVSSIKELVRRWYPKTYYGRLPSPGNHRALGDTLDSIAELAYYRQAVMAPLPTDSACCDPPRRSSPPAAPIDRIDPVDPIDRIDPDDPIEQQPTPRSLPT